MTPEPVLVIGLDCAEPRLIEKWTKDGTLPNLKCLIANGSYGRIESTSDWLGGSPWPTFYTGKIPAEHGLYHVLQWRADQMRHAEVNPKWLPVRPFWRELANMGYHVVAIDIPMVYPPEPFNGVEVYGWATGDILGTKNVPILHPPQLIDMVRNELGIDPIPFGEETHGIESSDSLLLLRNRLLKSTNNLANLAEELMKLEKWDLFLVCFSAPHRGGHKLWDSTGVWKLHDQEEFSHALRDLYVACDAAVGRLVKTAGDDVTKLVFSLHGMGSNTDRHMLLQKMLDKILCEKKSRTGLLKRLKEFIPGEARIKITSNSFTHLLYKLYQFTSKKQEDSKNYDRTPAFSLISDQPGYIRINLKGREASGIVNPGQEYDNLCSRIIEGLNTFVDYDTGKPVVENIFTSEQLFKQGSRMDNLPDMMVRWSSEPAANHKAIVSDRYGIIPWVTPGRNPSGRSGNHRSTGFLIANGHYIKPGVKIVGAHILDLAPTICALLEAPKPWNMCGKVIPEIQSK
jgi:predicted AlkP superfamily phosphohydrolase/phosphomutase